jgi:type II secretory ATPase GspE/PulE/Tfp pilus assembly ATPase PilB-like protein
MDKQNKRIIIRVDDELKENFKIKSDEYHMSISSRLKYLMKLDIENKLKINYDGEK